MKYIDKHAVNFSICCYWQKFKCLKLNLNSFKFKLEILKKEKKRKNTTYSLPIITHFCKIYLCIHMSICVCTCDSPSAEVREEHSQVGSLPLPCGSQTNSAWQAGSSHWATSQPYVTSRLNGNVLFFYFSTVNHQKELNNTLC